MGQSRSSRKRAVSVAAVFVIALGAAGCARVQEVSPLRIPFVDVKPAAKVSQRLTAEPPHAVAVLPFGSLSKTVSKKIDGRGILRNTFYSYFKLLPFQSMDIKEVDQVLSKNSLTDIAQINGTSAAKLGALLGVDAVIYGDIKSALNFTGGVYSLTELNGTLKMVDVKSGEVLWQCKHFEKAIGGVISTDSSELVSIIESQIENAKTSLAYTRCADTFTMKVLQTMPKITAVAPVLPQIEKVEIRPAGKRLFALFDTIEIVMTGEKGLPAFFDIGALKENMPMTEIQPGVYRGTHLVSRGDVAREASIVGKLGVAELGRQSVLPALDPVTIEARPPSAPKNVTFKVTGALEIVLAWDPSESGAVVSYEIYRAADYTFRYARVGSTDKMSYADQTGALHPLPETVFYQVIARDANNNRSDPSDPLKVPLK